MAGWSEEQVKTTLDCPEGLVNGKDDGGKLRREEFRPRIPSTVHETVQQAIVLPPKGPAPQAGEASGLPFSTT
jgi:hypothetical protein